MELKGIGPYTASALAVFTRTERVMPIDTNIRRVLDRLLLGKLWPDPKLDEKLETRSKPLLSGKNFELVPQALFDLATSVCKKVPDCAACPLRAECPAAKKFLSGKITAPKALIKKSREKIHRNKKLPDRIYRGRILKLVREAAHPLNKTVIGPLIDPTFDRNLDTAWLEAMIDRLVKDQFIKKTKGAIRLY
jgi:A/G-specific adenine glycosylase